MIRVLRIQPSGEATIVTVDPILENLRELIGGGYLEAIHGTAWWGSWYAYCDEEGKLKDLPVNELATALAKDNGWASEDVLRGDVVFFGPPDGEGDETDVSATLTAMVAAIVDPDPAEIP